MYVTNVIISFYLTCLSEGARIRHSSKSARCKSVQKYVQVFPVDVNLLLQAEFANPRSKMVS